MAGKTDLDMRWERVAAELIRAELNAHDLNMNDLSKRLTEAGNVISHKAVRLKVARAGFSAGFFLQCLAAIGSDRVRQD